MAEISFDDAYRAVLEAVTSAARNPHYHFPDAVLKLAEAYAWLNSPSQPHGGSTEVKVSK